MPRVGRIAVAVAALALPAGCGGGEKVEGPPPTAPERITLSSPAFAAGATIPKRFSCDGDGISPPLAWRGIPADARSLALLVEDPDAPGGTFVHWTLFDIPTDSDGVRAGGQPSGARSGENSFGDRGYGGPCPPEDDAPHRYRFVLYALRDRLGLEAGASPQDVRAAIGVRAGGQPSGARSGENSFGDRGYGGPCPPEDDPPHRYRFVLYALRDRLGLEAGASPQDVRAAIGERAIARGQLTGRFGR